MTTTVNCSNLNVHNNILLYINDEESELNGKIQKFELINSILYISYYGFDNLDLDKIFNKQRGFNR